MQSIFKGIAGLLSSRKGVLSLLMLSATVWLALAGRMDMAVATCFGVIQSIYAIVQHLATQSNRVVPFDP